VGTQLASLAAQVSSLSTQLAASVKGMGVVDVYVVDLLVESAPPPEAAT
jgi:hypothetical protein